MNEAVKNDRKRIYGYIKSFDWIIIMILQRNKFIVAGEPEYKEIDSINSVQSSLKSHSLYRLTFQISIF